MFVWWSSANSALSCKSIKQDQCFETSLYLWQGVGGRGWSLWQGLAVYWTQLVSGNSPTNPPDDTAETIRKVRPIYLILTHQRRRKGGGAPGVVDITLPLPCHQCRGCLWSRYSLQPMEGTVPEIGDSPWRICGLWRAHTGAGLSWRIAICWEDCCFCSKGKVWGGTSGREEL